MDYNRQKYNNKNSNSYYYQGKRNQAANYCYWNSNAQYTPQWRWVQHPPDNRSKSFNKPYKANQQRLHSDEPSAKRHASLGAVSHQTAQTAAETAPQSDSLTYKLSERTSTIINNVLSGKNSSDAKDRAKTGAVQSDRSSAGHPVNTSHASSSSQSKRPENSPSDKPKNTGGGTEKSLGASRLKAPTSSSYVSRENVAASQPNKGSTPSRPDILLSPNSAASRTPQDAQASLVRMATAPRSRREQLELERMIHEHAKKSATTAERLHELQPTAGGTGTSAEKNSAVNMPQLYQADSGRPTEATSSSLVNDVIVIGDENGKGSTANVQESRPSSSSAVQSMVCSTTCPKKPVKKPRVNKNKPKTARVPKTKTVAAKTAKGKVTKNQAPKRSRKQQNLNKVYHRGLRQANPLPFIGAGDICAAGPSPSQISSLLHLDTSTGLGSLGLLSNLAPGLVGSQHMFTSPTNRAASSLPATPVSLQATDRGPLNTLLEMSLHEEDLCSRLSQCGSEIEQLQHAMAKLDEELQKRMQLKLTLLEEQAQLRQSRLQLLQDSVVPSQSNQAGSVMNIAARDAGSEDGTLPSMYGVEAGVGDGADNATYCRGVQPIMIEPMDCESGGNDVEPLTPTDTSAAVRQNTSGITRPSVEGVTPPGMRVVYCGTVSREQLLEQSALGGLAQSVIGRSNNSPLVSGVRTSESRGRNLSDVTRDSRTGAAVPAECVPSDVGGLIAADNSRPAVSVQRHDTTALTACQAKQQLPSDIRPAAASSSVSVVSTGRKSGPGAKSRRTQSLDSESSRTGRNRAAAAVSSSAGSAAVSMIHSLPGHAAVRCISVLQNAVICACNDGQVYRIPLSKFGGAGGEDNDDGFTWTDGPVMCMLATRAGPDRLITLFAVTTNKQLVISSYPSPAVKKIFPGVQCYSYNCIADAGRTVYVGLCDGRIASIPTSSMKRKKNDIACGRGDGSHVCALAMARVCSQSLICIAVSDSNEILIRDSQTAKPYGTPLSGLSSPARYLQGLCHYCISSNGGSEVHVHSLQTCLMERRFSFSSGVVGLAVRIKEKQAVVADGNGTISCIAVKDGVRYAMYTRQMITAIGAANDVIFVGTADSKVLRIPADSPCHWKCRYLHCLCCFWRAEDLQKHLLDDHVDHLLMSAGTADTITCKWEACLEVLAANTKALHRHFTEHAANEQPITTKS